MVSTIPKSKLQKNKLNKFFLLNLPVGSGKSHLALMIADWYKKNVNRMARVDIITNSKILQDQYSGEYESICDLKGKENYECQSYSCSCAQGSEFNRLNKTLNINNTIITIISKDEDNASKIINKIIKSSSC